MPQCSMSLCLISFVNITIYDCIQNYVCVLLINYASGELLSAIVVPVCKVTKNILKICELQV